MTFFTSGAYRIVWLILMILLLVLKYFDIALYYPASLIPLILVTYAVKVEKFKFYYNNKILNTLILGISFFLFFFSLNNLLGFINEPYKRIILIMLIIAYYYLTKLLLGKYDKTKTR
jgi:hypothetical protein